MRIEAIRRGENRAGDFLIDQAHQLRARVFRDRLGWEVTVEEGREFDEYDRLDPTYVLVLQGNATLIGCARLLPGSGPTMLTRTFPRLLDGRTTFDHRSVESSRFCVDTGNATSAQDRRGLNAATMTLFAGILEWSLANGYDEVITVTDLRLERIFSRAGLPFHRLGQPAAIGNTVAIAGTIAATFENALRVRPAGYQPLLEPLRKLAA